MRILCCLMFISNFCIGQNTILWEVIDTQSGNKSFIVGTFHSIGNSFIDSIPILKTALKNAEVAIFESIDDETKLKHILQQRHKRNRINKFLSGEDLLKLKKLSKDWETDYSILRPIELIVTLRREFQLLKCKTVSPTDEFDHFDNYLIDLAKKLNVSLVGLETDSLQLKILHDLEKSLSKEAMTHEISFWISKLTSNQTQYEECDETQDYLRFEIDYEFSNDCEDDILIKKRNDDWMPTLLDYFTQKKCFLAVGLLHLKYTCGILENFRRNGFIVNPVKIENGQL